MCVYALKHTRMLAVASVARRIDLDMSPAQSERMWRGSDLLLQVYSEDEMLAHERMRRILNSPEPASRTQTTRCVKNVIAAHHGYIGNTSRSVLECLQLVPLS